MTWAKYLVPLALAAGLWLHGWNQGIASAEAEHSRAIAIEQAAIDQLRDDWRDEVADINRLTAIREQELITTLELAHARNATLEQELANAPQILPPRTVEVPGVCPRVVSVDWDRFARLHNTAKGLAGADRKPSAALDTGRQPSPLR